MTEISTSRSLRFLLFFASFSLHFISGFCDDAKDSKNNSKTKSDVVNTGTKMMMNSRLSLAYGTSCTVRTELIIFEAEMASVGCVV
ncbi:hypothetical protein V6N13_134222 [Hibiscus sabdariffa]|uniref:Secreted protein n=1 Tax=Hibiscus sabdariffa TaxID=183260 RepID=A0ABR2R3J5_9ROSI